MANFIFKFSVSIKYLINICPIYVSNSDGTFLAKEEYIVRPKPFNWIKAVERRLINYQNEELALIKNNSIIVEENEWYLNQTVENNYRVKKNVDSYSTALEFPVLGQWELTHRARVLKFDGSKFLNNDQLIKGIVTLHVDPKLLFNTYCELESSLPNDYLIFAFLISILHRYAEYRLMGHNVWSP